MCTVASFVQAHETQMRIRKLMVKKLSREGLRRLIRTEAARINEASVHGAGVEDVVSSLNDAAMQLDRADDALRRAYSELSAVGHEEHLSEVGEWVEAVSDMVGAVESLADSLVD